MVKLSEWSVKRPVTTTMILAALILTGFIVYPRLPMNIFPEVSYPGVSVWFSYRDSSPEEIEKNIIKIIEDNVSKLNNIKRISSRADNSGGYIFIEYDWDTDMDFAALDVREVLDRIANQLPDDLKNIFVFKFDMSALPVMRFVLSAELDKNGLYDFINNYFLYKLKQIPGVGKVEVFGFGEKEISVTLDNSKLLADKIGYFDIYNSINDYNIKIPVGKIKTDYQDINIRLKGEFTDLNQLSNLPVKSSVTGQTFFLKDIAKIKYDFPEEDWHPRFNGQPAIIVNIIKKSDANTVSLCDRVIKKLNDISEENKKYNLNMYTFFNQADEIKKSLNMLRESGIMGALMAIVVIFFFLREWRPTLLITLCIPVTIILTFNFMYFADISINLMSLSGLMLSVGMLVDNAIVVVENIFSRRQSGLNNKTAAVQGTAEVTGPVSAATMTTIIVFLPILFVMKSMLGKMISAVGMTMGFALISSLFMALSFIPMATVFLFKQKLIRKKTVIERIRKWYIRLLKLCMKYSAVTVIIIIAVFSATLYFIFPELKKEGMPEPSQREVEIRLNVAPDADSTLVYKYRDLLQNNLTRNKKGYGIQHIFSFINGARVRFYCSLSDNSKETRVVATELKKKLPKLPDANIRITSEFGHRGRSDLHFNISGENMDILKNISQEIISQLKNIKGLVQINTSEEKDEAELVVGFTGEKLSKNNIRSEQLANVVNMSLRGHIAGYIREGSKETDIRIISLKDRKDGLREMKKIAVKTSDNTVVPLENFAYFTHSKLPSKIQHENKKRVIHFRGIISAEADKQKVIDESFKIAREYNYPRGYSFGIGRFHKEDKEDMKNIVFACIVAVLLVYVVMASQFESLMAPLVIMLTLPFAFIGVVLILYLTDTSLNPMSGSGLLILIGIVVNNAIVLVNNIVVLQKKNVPVTHAVLRAAKNRFRPILITALTTILGLLPMSLGPGLTKILGMSDSGSIVYYPLARTVIGGLTASTFLTLLVLPVMYIVIVKIWEKLRTSLTFSA